MEIVSTEILITGMVIFIARIFDVSVGTIRTITTIQGRTTLSFILGFIEVSIWVTVISTIITRLYESPLLALFYGFGYATGNVVGIRIERRLALGYVQLHIFTHTGAGELTKAFQKQGLYYTCFIGQGMNGPIDYLFVLTKRKNVRNLLLLIQKIDPDAFYSTDIAQNVSNLVRPVVMQPTGWRSVLKKK